MVTGEAPDGGSELSGGGERVSGGAGATRLYVCPRRDQLFLLPVCMRDWLAEGHLAWFVLDVVAELDTGALHRRRAGVAGRPPYEPEMMCALLLYAYCCGVRSSRRIEAACRTDAAFRVICGGLVPDHATIARFVADHEQALAGLFVSGLRVCAAAGLCDLSVVALDGTRIAADAALDRNRDAEWIRREVAKLMAVTAEEEQPGAPGAQRLGDLEGPAEISSPAGREARLRAALAVIEGEQKAAAAEAELKARAAATEAGRGRLLSGRKPKSRSPRSRAPRSSTRSRWSASTTGRPRGRRSSPRPCQRRSRLRHRAGSSGRRPRWSGRRPRSPRRAKRPRTPRRPRVRRTSPIPTAGS